MRPNFDLLTKTLLRETGVVELKHCKISKDGKFVTLVPVRGSDHLVFEYMRYESLPTLDLQAAGIEWDRRPETVLASVQEYLRGHPFTVEPQFELMAVAAILPELRVCLMAGLGIMQLQVNRPGVFGYPPRDPHARLLQLLGDDLPVSFLLRSSGELLPGLNVSKSVEGPALVVVPFLLPEYPEAGSVLATAMEAAKRYFRSWSIIVSHRKAYMDAWRTNTKRWRISPLRLRFDLRRRVKALSEVRKLRAEWMRAQREAAEAISALAA